MDQDRKGDKRSRSGRRRTKQSNRKPIPEEPPTVDQEPMEVDEELGQLEQEAVNVEGAPKPKGFFLEQICSFLSKTRINEQESSSENATAPMEDSSAQVSLSSSEAGELGASIPTDPSTSATITSTIARSSKTKGAFPPPPQNLILPDVPIIHKPVHEIKVVNLENEKCKKPKARKKGPGAKATGSKMKKEESEDKPEVNSLQGHFDNIPSLSYYLKGIANETNETHKSNIYGVAFNNFASTGENGLDIFATCGDDQITVYESSSKYPGGFKPVFMYKMKPIKNMDNKGQSQFEEEYYTVAWAMVPNSSEPHKSEMLLCAAGLSGLITVIDTHNETEKTLRAHGGAVNDLNVHAMDSHLMLSASKDLSIILWNLRSKQPVLRFGGDEGHHDQVLSVDFHLTKRLFVSGGYDRVLFIWQYDKPKQKIALRLSDSWHLNYHRDDHNDSFPTQCDYTPYFATRDVHCNVIDCVKWFNDIIFSRSAVEQLIIMWKPGRDINTKLSELKYKSLYKGMKEESSDDEETKKERNKDDTKWIRFNLQQEDGSCKSIGIKTGLIKFNLPEGDDATTPTESTSTEPILTTSGVSIDDLIAKKLKGKGLEPLPDVNIMIKLKCPDTMCWFMRFGMNYMCKLLACGTNNGDIFLWDLTSVVDPGSFRSVTIPVHESVKNKNVRQIAFNESGTAMVAVTDGCNVIKYEIVRKDSVKVPKVVKTFEASNEVKRSKGQRYEFGEDLSGIQISQLLRRELGEGIMGIRVNQPLRQELGEGPSGSQTNHPLRHELGEGQSGSQTNQPLRHELGEGPSGSQTNQPLRHELGEGPSGSQTNQPLQHELGEGPSGSQISQSGKAPRRT